MSVAATIDIRSAGQARLIERAAAFAKRAMAPCFVIAVVDELPYGRCTDGQRAAVRRNLDLIASCDASPVLQEGREDAGTLVTIGRFFNVSTLFVAPQIAERLLVHDPPFDVVIVA